MYKYRHLYRVWGIYCLLCLVRRLYVLVVVFVHCVCCFVVCVLEFCLVVLIFLL